MKLERSSAELKKAPIRIVHIGLGAFHRAHQAWYTNLVDTNKEWGIAAFTGRNPEAAEKLNSQDNLYTLIERGPERDNFSLISAISASHDIDDYWRLKEYIGDPIIAMITLTITEAGYHLNSAGNLDRDNSLVDEDLENLFIEDYVPHTILFKLTSGLVKRYKLNGKPITILSCDNVAANGVRLQAAMSEIFSFLPPEIDTWFKSAVAFPSSSVDRITPRTTEKDLEIVREVTGFSDCTPVVTEPFSNWIIQGAFPAGRPAWENAGAIFVNEIEPFENRKLWLLNGAHSLMAYAGLNQGIATVADAMKSSDIRALVEAFWAEASTLLPAPELQLDDYKKALISRFENHRIEHQLPQIAIDGATKLTYRAVPVIKALLKNGEFPDASAHLIAQWVKFCLNNAEIVDSRSAEIGLATASLDPIQACISILDLGLSENTSFVTYVKNVIKNQEAISE